MNVNRVMGRRWAGVIGLVCVWGVSLGGEAGPATRPAPGATTAPSVTITGRKLPVEQGERSMFRALPPRDLLKWPLTESPGLETSTSVVGSEEIRWLDAYSVVDALEYVPGAWTERRGRKVKEFLSVRGQRYPYPGYLIDGAWFREFHETGYFLSAANVERIEVLRSSGALLLSPGGMAGLVNIVPKTYTKRETRIDAVYGSDSTVRTQLSHGDAVDGLSYALGVGYRHTDGPSHENAAENITNFYGRIVATPVPEWTLTLTGLSFFGDRELQLADPPATNVLQTRRDHFDPMHTYLFVGKARYQPNDRAATEVVANYALRRFHGHRVGQPDWLEKDYEYGLRLMQSLRLGEANILRFGGMYNHWVSPTGKRFYVGRRGDLDTYSGMIVDEHDFGRLTVNGGYRVSRTYFDEFGGLNVEGTAGNLQTVQMDNDWEDPLHTFTLGAVYELTADLSLHGNVTWGQLAATPGMLSVDLGRPGAEARTKCDLGVKRQWDGFGEVSVTGFYVHQKNAAVMTNATVAVNGVDYGLYANADRESYGVELDVRSKRFDNGLQFFVNAVAMQTQQENAGRWVQDKEVPRLVLGGGVSWLFRNVELSVLVKRVSPYENQRFLPGGSDPVGLGDFTEVSTKATYYFGSEKQHNVFFGVENVCNRHFSTVAGWPDEGVRFKGGVSLGF